MHFGTPCQSWSNLYQNMGPGIRTSTCWHGSGDLDVEILGNITLGVTVLLMRGLYECGGSFSFEHPLCARSWSTPALRAIAGWQDVQLVRIDQCAYGLRPAVPKDTFYLKPTRLLLYGPNKFLPKRCPGDHAHTVVLGGSHDATGRPVKRSTEAGVYPAALCRAIAKFHFCA